MTITDRSRMKVFCDVKLMEHIDINTDFSSTKYFFNQNFISTNVFSRVHFPGTLLTSYWPHLLMSIWYLQFDSMISKSGLLLVCLILTIYWSQFEVRVPTGLPVTLPLCKLQIVHHLVSSVVRTMFLCNVPLYNVTWIVTINHRKSLTQK